jgi:crotonobetainyl-CoA hydratase
MEARKMTDIGFRRDGHIAFIRLNRPDVMNALNCEQDVQLAAIWKEVNEDPAIRVAVIESAGERAFCVGADLKDLERRSGSEIGFGGGLTGLGGPMVKLRKPLVAAVRGLALGAGFELAMCADVIVAAEDAEFGLPETKIGVIGDAGVLHRITRQIPYRIAMGMILTGRRMNAARASELGLVNEVVPAEDLESKTHAWASDIASASPLVVQAAKSVANTGLGGSLEDAVTASYEDIEAFLLSSDRVEAVEAIKDRRRPIWKGE